MANLTSLRNVRGGSALTQAYRTVIKDGHKGNGLG